MAIVAKDVNYEYIKENKLEDLLSITKLKSAITSKNRDDLKELIFDVYETLYNDNIKLKNFYYGNNVVMSNEKFDMFSIEGIKELFNLFGYEVKEVKGLDNKDDDLWVGKVIITKNIFSFEMKAELSMHDSLITIFVDTKTAKIITL